MSKKTIVRFVVKGGKLKGKTLEREIPDFDFKEFVNVPNADIFVRKAYFSHVKKLMRESEENINGTRDQHLQSVESIIARSTVIPKNDMDEWLDSRDWDKAEFTNPEIAISQVKKLCHELRKWHDSTLANYPEELRNRLANKLAGIADTPQDSMADFIFSKLTQQQLRGGSLADI